MTGSGRAGTTRERREPATPPTPAPGPRPPAGHVSSKMAAPGREAGAAQRGQSVVPVGAGEMPKVGGDPGWLGPWFLQPHCVSGPF